MRKRSLVCVLLPFLCCLLGPPAAGAADPSSNFVVSPNCSGPAPCLAEAIQFLDQARASLGEAPYQLPAGFASLDPARQAFVLTNLDRLAAGLRPITGLTTALDQAAAGGIHAASDPAPTDPSVWSFASNWAEGYLNMPLAYEAWMYDDGLGSDNLDCTALNRSGCWGHRHDILFQFDGTGPLEMGAAAGSGPGGLGYTLVLAQAAPGSKLAYTYTWSDAVAAGAGGPVHVIQARSARFRRRRRRHRRSARIRRALDR